MDATMFWIGSSTVAAGGSLGGWVWQMAKQSARVDSLERQIRDLWDVHESMTDRVTEMADRIARMEPMLKYVVDHLPVG